MPTAQRPLVPLLVLAALAAGCAGAPVRGREWEAAPEPGPEAPARHAADERFLLTPSPLVLERGTVVLSDDEVLLLRLGLGVAGWLQLDLTAGALPFPGAAGGAVPAHGVIAGGGGGVAVLGLAGLGLKAQVVEEGPVVPAVALAYDFVDLFGGAVGGAGFVILGNGVAGGGVGAVGAANLQFNLFTLTAGKRFGERLRAGAGLWVVDNHHLVPQAAGFTSITTDGATGGATRTISRLPTELIPFANGELWLGGGFSSMAELMPRGGGETFGTLAFRWVSGREERRGLSRWVRIKVDAGALFGRGPETSRRSGRAVALPWAGLALYFF